MACFHKYLLKQFVKYFLIIQLIILVLFVFIDYLSRMNRFLNSDLSLIGALGYVMLKVPFMFVQLTPASILLASITVFGLMNRNNELLAIRSSGISIYYLVKPAILIGLALSCLMFFLGETLIPISIAKANFIKYNVIKKQRNLLSAKRDIWIKSANRLIHINFYDPVKQIVAGVTISTLGENFLLASRIDAEKGRYIDGQWVFEKIVEQTHVKDAWDYDVTLSDKKIISLSLKPEDLSDVSKKSEEMSFFELRKLIKKVKDEGYDATTYRVDLNAKIAFPFICIIMVLTGAATGMRGFAKENIPGAIAIGVVIAFLYWVMYGLCLSLGYGSILPPVISAWAANFFFLPLGTLYLIKTE
ncbi:MAG: LPS export ABC transporter permease LptG [Desulfobacula sp.]|nr:LPS export ABC transporter permease LptG [Desulfobacula sp.]